jgi:BolA protein
MIDNAERIVRIRALLSKALHTDRIDITDDSHMHAGHEGARSGKGHFTVVVISDDFSNVRTLGRHRMIYDALGDMMDTDIHALSIQAKTPAEAR